MLSLDKDDFELKINVSENPWVKDYQSFYFSKKKIDLIIDDLIKVCSNKNHKNSFDFIPYIESYIKRKYSNNDLCCLIPLYSALFYILEKDGKSFEYEWNNPYFVIKRCLKILINYSDYDITKIKNYTYFFIKNNIVY